MRGGYLGGAAQVVVVDLLDGLEVDDPFQLGLVFVCGDRATCSGQIPPHPEILTDFHPGGR